MLYRLVAFLSIPVLGVAAWFGVQQATESGEAAQPWRVVDNYINHEDGLWCFRIDIISVDLPDQEFCVRQSTEYEKIAGIVASHVKVYVDTHYEILRWQVPKELSQ